MDTKTKKSANAPSKKTPDHIQLTFSLAEEDPSCAFEPVLMTDILLEAYLKELGLLRLFQKIRQEERTPYDLLEYIKLVIMRRLLTPLEEFGYIDREDNCFTPLAFEEYDATNDYDMMDIIIEHRAEIFQAVKERLAKNKPLLIIYSLIHDRFFDCAKETVLEQKTIQIDEWVQDETGFTETYAKAGVYMKFKHRIIEENKRKQKEILLWDRESSSLFNLLEYPDNDIMSYQLITTTETDLDDIETIKLMYATRDIDACVETLKDRLKTDEDPDLFEAYYILWTISLTMIYAMIWKTIKHETKDTPANWLSLIPVDQVQKALNIFMIEQLTPSYYRFRSMTFDKPGRYLKRILLSHGVELPKKLYTLDEVKSLKSKIRIL